MRALSRGWGLLRSTDSDNIINSFPHNHNIYVWPGVKLQKYKKEEPKANVKKEGKKKKVKRERLLGLGEEGMWMSGGHTKL